MAKSECVLSSSPRNFLSENCKNFGMNVFRGNHVPQMNRDPSGLICVVQCKEPRNNLSEGIYIQFEVSLPQVKNLKDSFIYIFWIIYHRQVCLNKCFVSLLILLLTSGKQFQVETTETYTLFKLPVAMATKYFISSHFWKLIIQFGLCMLQDCS